MKCNINLALNVTHEDMRDCSWFLETDVFLLIDLLLLSVCQLVRKSLREMKKCQIPSFTW